MNYFPDADRDRGWNAHQHHSIDFICSYQYAGIFVYGTVSYGYTGRKYGENVGKRT